MRLGIVSDIHCNIQGLERALELMAPFFEAPLHDVGLAAPALGDVVLNEIMAENLSTVTNGGTLPDWIELRNHGASATNLAGWSLSDDSNPRKFVFPANTPLAAGGYGIAYEGTVSAGETLRT